MVFRTSALCDYCPKMKINMQATFFSHKQLYCPNMFYRDLKLTFECEGKLLKAIFCKDSGKHLKETIFLKNDHIKFKIT